MARLPQPGGDSGNWGAILNDYLSQSLKPDGALKDNAVNAAIIADGSITETLLDANVQAKLNNGSTVADGSVTTAKLADSAVTNTKLASGIDQSKITNLAADLTNRPSAVIVATGNEPRPIGSSIAVWYGGATQPTNMGTSDIWITAGTIVAPSDTTPPSVPTGFTTSAITANSVTLIWNASTDNTAVTGYEVRRGGTTSAGTPTTTSLNIAGLSPSTDYTFEVRAHDGAGNWSDWSSPALSVSTTAQASDEFSIFNGVTPPGVYTVHNDGVGALTVATSFYKTVGDSRCIGGRIWIPGGGVWDTGNLPITVTAYVSGMSGEPNWGSPVASKQITSLTENAWNDIYFDSPISFNAYSSGTPERVWIAYREALGSKYTHAPTPTSDFIESSTLPGLYLSEENIRSANTAGGITTAMYGIDVIVDEG